MPRQARPNRDTARSHTPGVPRAIDRAAASSGVPAVLPGPWNFLNGLASLTVCAARSGPARPAKCRAQLLPAYERPATVRQRLTAAGDRAPMRASFGIEGLVDWMLSSGLATRHVSGRAIAAPC